ncbi:MAG: hypothetical protein J6W66_02015, partial [Lachnospiraceae bacterium]|nr:hypothetical protein [Lachnospiraceae bacterium]
MAAAAAVLRHDLLHLLVSYAPQVAEAAAAAAACCAMTMHKVEQRTEASMATLDGEYACAAR